MSPGCNEWALGVYGAPRGNGRFVKRYHSRYATTAAYQTENLASRAAVARLASRTHPSRPAGAYTGEAQAISLNTIPVMRRYARQLLEVFNRLAAAGPSGRAVEVGAEDRGSTAAEDLFQA